MHQTLNYFLKVWYVGYDEEFMPYLSSFDKHFPQICVLAKEILAANQRSRIMSREVSCVGFDLSFLSDVQCLNPLQHFGSVAA